MKRSALVILITFCFSTTILSQEFTNLWDGHFSYFNTTDVTRSENLVYVAAENAVFSYNPLNQNIEEITTVEGLSGDTITTIEYVEEFNQLYIGYETGLIEIFFEVDNTVLSIVDIVEKQTISPNNKRINDFNYHDGLVYISTNFGISVYDSQRLEFGDTYFLGTGGAQIRVSKTAIFNDAIYAACLNNNGLKRGLLSNDNLIDFDQWETFAAGTFVSLEKIGQRNYVVRFNRDVLELVNDNLVYKFTLSSILKDSVSSDGFLVFTENNNVSIYDPDSNLVTSVSNLDGLSTNFNSAQLINSNLYIATSSVGSIKIDIQNTDEYEEIRPTGPLRNSIFKVNATANGVWAVFGDYNINFDPFPLRQYGISKLLDEDWLNIPFDSLLGAREVSDVAVNPFSPNQTFMASFFDGILELENETPTFLYNQNNSGLETDYPDHIRVSDVEFDANGLLWSTTSRVRRPIKSYDIGSNTWQEYDIEEVVPDLGEIGLGTDDEELGFGDLDIDSNGTKWFGSFFNGLIAFNETINGGVANNVSREDQNMPITKVRAVAVDQRNQVWIGTDKGLRVLFNSSGFFEDENPSVNQIIILEDGIPKELLESQFITDIKVDGSNNKWVGTLDSGVFYFSPDGQETIYHFTKSNSPLPSNRINDISVDQNDGRVFMATARGMVSFTSGGSEPEETLTDTYVYPNPVRPEYDILGFNDLNDINKGVKIKGLSENVNVKIVDVAGNLVAEAQSRVNLRSSRANYNFAIDGGTGIWNGKNLRGNVVSSGVYLILISDLDSFETKTLKLLIVR